MKNTDTHTIGVIISLSSWEKLKEIATKNKRSTSSQACLAIEQFLEAELAR